MEGTQMKTKKSNAPKKAKKAAKRAQVKSKTTPAVKQSKLAIKVAVGVRAKAARRTAEGKFTKIIFNQIGGKECRRFAAMTWKERDAYMAKAEKGAGWERQEKRLAR